MRYHYKEHEIDENRGEIQYAKKIVSGEYKSCRLEYLSCKRFLDDLERQNDEDFPYCYDTSRSDRFFAFFEKCPNPAVAGETLKLAEFQRYDFGCLMGWVEKETGCRRFQESLMWQARGNFKSTATAALCLYVMCADAIYPPYHPELRWYENDPSVTVLAVDKEQTKEVRGYAAKMVRNSDFLKQRIKVGNGNDKSTYIRSIKFGGDMISISSEVGNLDGGKPNLIVSDEYGAHTDEERANTLKGGAGKKAQFLYHKISTASQDANTKPAKADYDKCIEILNGNIIDETYFIIIRELEEKDDPADFTLYEKCSPVFRENTTYSRRLLKAVQLEYKKAFQGGTAKQKIEYLIKRTNRWQVASEEKFFQQEELDKLQKAQIPREEFYKLVQSHNTVVGYDASVEIDLTAQAYVFNLPDNKVGIDVHAFMPEGTLIKHKNTDKLPYEYYNEQGLLTLVDGDTIDDWEVMQYMCDYENKHDLQIVGFSADRAFATQMLIALEMGRTPNGKTYSTIECPQTTAVLNEACLLIKKLNLDGRLVICENELLMKHFANAYAVYDKGGRVKISKKDKSSAFRIDLFAAILNALRKIDLLESENLINAIMSGKYSFLG